MVTAYVLLQTEVGSVAQTLDVVIAKGRDPDAARAINASHPRPFAAKTQSATPLFYVRLDTAIVSRRRPSPPGAASAEGDGDQAISGTCRCA